VDNNGYKVLAAKLLCDKPITLLIVKGTKGKAKISKSNWATFACLFLCVFAFYNLFGKPKRRIIAKGTEGKAEVSKNN
jgi:hypothetical protein